MLFIKVSVNHLNFEYIHIQVLFTLQHEFRDSNVKKEKMLSNDAM